MLTRSGAPGCVIGRCNFSKLIVIVNIQKDFVAVLLLFASLNVSFQFRFHSLVLR